MVREELNQGLFVGGVKVSTAIQKVEDELSRWKCNRYKHITRGVSAQENAVIHLETTFSKPTQDKPVPVAVARVHFHLDVVNGRLKYHFEEESVQHEVGGRGLAPGMYERWLDRIIGDKMQVRQLHNLATPFEETRLQPPPMPTAMIAESREDSSDEREDGRSSRQEEERASGYWDPAQKLPLSELLVNIFDAADEDDEYELTHKEVADLLYATPMGLTDWDIKLLLTTAHELETGRIVWKPFVEACPEFIEALLKRRAAFEERTQNVPQVGFEAIELCFGEEIDEAARAGREAFAAVDQAGKGKLSRHDFRSSLMHRMERFSMQEVQLLMQICKEDDFGQVPYDDFGGLLAQLRIDALHNAMVETDVDQLRKHLIILSRQEGMGEDLILPVWNLRNVLLSADQLCLSRMQIHVILSIVQTDEEGLVDFQYFLRVCCTVIPQMFDVGLFAEKAAAIAKEKADAQARQELEELQGIASSSLAANKKRSDEDDVEEAQQANVPDKNDVEKALLMHITNHADDKHRQQSTIDVRRFLSVLRMDPVQQLQLSDAELRGFIAEAELDEERNEVAYADHIRTWVLILFELRKSRIYDGIFAKDWAMDAPHLVDLSEYEENFPLLKPLLRSSTASVTSETTPERRRSRMSSKLRDTPTPGPGGVRRGASRLSDRAISSDGVDTPSLETGEVAGSTTTPRRKSPS
mmetsp:Transcript_126714/g.253259  ORF Transcript_126714/g.253259 Transcript_126714/m.253259 type:complete len:697 (-) Transcript_126714:68-2158(-)